MERRGRLSRWRGAITTVQMHYNESGGHTGAVVGEESACSAPVALGPLALSLGSHKVKMLYPWTSKSNLLITVLAFSSCLTNCLH